MTLDPNTYGKPGKCAECRERVWRCRWSGYAIALEVELPIIVPPAGRGVGAMEWSAELGAWVGHRRDRPTGGEVRLVHKCPGNRPVKRESEREEPTMSDPWDSPGSSAGVSFEELKGRLLIITAHAAEEIPTSFGEKESVRADITVLDGPGSPVDHKDALIFPKVLIGQLRSNIGTGKMVLGRLGQGVAKPGQKPPWLLADPTDDDRAIARKWYESSRLPF